MKRRGFLASLFAAPVVAKVALVPEATPLVAKISCDTTAFDTAMREAVAPVKSTGAILRIGNSTLEVLEIDGPEICQEYVEFCTAGEWKTTERLSRSGKVKIRRHEYVSGDRHHFLPAHKDGGSVAMTLLGESEELVSAVVSGNRISISVEWPTAKVSMDGIIPNFTVHHGYNGQRSTRISFMIQGDVRLS